MKGMTATLALLLFSGIAMGQTSSSSVIVNPGNPSWATFYFPGNTQIVFQCAYSRGYYITNVGVYGEQQVTEFSLPGCTSQTSHNAAGQLVVSYTVTGAPFSFEAGGQTITMDSASWASTEQGCGRAECYKQSVGSAQFTAE